MGTASFLAWQHFSPVRAAEGWEWQSGGADEIVVRGLRAPGFLMCDAAGLWSTEDSTHRARLLLLDFAGNTRTILSSLRSPQAIIAIGPDRFLLAEQGRGRILELARHPSARR